MQKPKAIREKEKAEFVEYLRNLKYQKCSFCGAPAVYFDETCNAKGDFWCETCKPDDGCDEEYGYIMDHL